MSKLLLLVMLVVTFFLVPKVSAEVQVGTLKECPSKMVRTSPDPLYSDPAKTPEADFFINVGNSSDYAGKWEMQFNCGLPGIPVIGIGGPNKDKAQVANDQEIFRHITNHGCEFYAGDHTIIVAVNGTNQCIAKYQVINSENQCVLSIDPDNGITSETELKVSGTNLASGGRFGLFVDDKLIKGTGINDFLSTPTFSGIPIPKDLRTPGTHVVSLKKYNDLGGTFDPKLSYLASPPLCPVYFLVGTPSNPGYVTKPTIGIGSSGYVGKPVVSGGKQCGTLDNPGISTAIGCIHTNPNEFAKDLLTFLLGIGGGVAFLMMLLGAFQMLTSAGNPDTLRAGKERLTSAVIGLLVVIFAVLLLQIIGVGILNIPGFK